MHYRVTLEDVLAAHADAMRFGGGRQGILNLGGIESAIARPYSGYHRSIESKAAAILHALIQNHGFVDGNKRTAWLVTDYMIRRSGYHFIPQQDEHLDDTVVAVASGKIDMPELILWFRQRLRKRR